jgi:hypothetical protein
MSAWRVTTATGLCRDCRSFEGRPLAVEAGLPMIASLSSAHGSSRADDGLCMLHDRFVRARAHCDAFDARPAPAASGSRP